MIVLHLTSFLRQEFGGPVTALVGLASAQAALGMEVVVVAVENRVDSSLVARLREAGVKVSVQKGRSPYGWSPATCEVLQDVVSSAAVVHIHGVWEHAQHLGAVVASEFGKPYIIRPCGMLDQWSLQQQRLKKRIYLAWRLRRHLNRAAAIHCTSDSEESGLKALGCKTSVIVEPNGVDVAEITAAEPGEFRQRYQIEESTPIVLYLGRLHPKKGVHLLVQAFARLKNNTAKLAIVGSGDASYVANLRHNCQNLGIMDRAIFTGELCGRERSAAYIDANVFVLPSKQENFANAVAEAVAAGTPVIVSDSVALHTAVRAANVGSVCRLDAEDISKNIEWWLEHREESASISGRAASFCANYSWPVIAKRWQTHYAKILREMSQ